MRTLLALTVVAVVAFAGCSKKKESCERAHEAFGMKTKGHPNLVPKSKAELDASIADIDARNAAYEAMRAEAHPEVQKAGDKLSADLRELGEMLRRPPKMSAPKSDKERVLQEAMDAAAVEAGLGLPANLYDGTGSFELGKRMRSSWVDLLETCY
jgi:hypothetical protein